MDESLELAVVSSADRLFDAQATPFAILTGAGRDGRMEQLRTAATGRWQGSGNEAAAIHQTGFFRDVRAFERLRTETLPRLIEAAQGERKLRIWCAGCSTGQEVYSVAMLLCEEFPELADWDVTVLGTDVSRGAVEYAARGRYRRAEVAAGLGDERLAKYFTERGGSWEVVGRVRAMCSFQAWDLRLTFPELAMFDLVLMRNVLLYIAAAERRRVLRAVMAQMKQEGAMVLGEIERPAGGAGKGDTCRSCETCSSAAAAAC